MSNFDLNLMLEYPTIDWQNPIKVRGPDGIDRFACRFCICKHGLKGTDTSTLPADESDAKDHIETHMRQLYAPG